MLVSFIVPTNRPFENFANIVFDNILELENRNYDIEIVCVSPNNPNRKDVLWVEEEIETGGSIWGCNEGAKRSNGDYIVLCCDDHVFDVNTLKIVDRLRGPDFDNRKYKIICIPTNWHGPCYLPNDLPQHIIARFPIFERKTYENLLGGYVFHPTFKHHYGDNWLGYYLGEVGEGVIEHDKHYLMAFNSQCETRNDEYDRSAFYGLVKRFEEGNKEYI